MVVKDIAVGAGGLEFDYRPGQIRHSVANNVTPPQRYFGAMLLRRSTAETGPATRSTLRRNTASVMEICKFSWHEPKVVRSRPVNAK